METGRERERGPLTPHYLRSDSHSPPIPGGLSWGLCPLPPCDGCWTLGVTLVPRRAQEHPGPL